MIAALIIPAFVAGVLTFLAPCTLPLVPGYLGFISGVSLEDLQDPLKARNVRRKIFINGVLYVIGFSAVFIVLGSLVGLGGSYLIQYRSIMSRIGGAFVILFGIFMLQMAAVYYGDRFPALRKFRLPGMAWLTSEHRLPLVNKLKPGKPVSSLP